MRYIGSGPYCYANAMSMMVDGVVSPSIVEVATGSPFGFQLLSGRLPMFDPFGWDPGIGLTDATAALGFDCDLADGTDDAEARLRAASPDAPLLAGPIEMGLLDYQPGMTGPIGADHFVVVIGVDGDHVILHDPHGHPYATQRIGRFVAAWSSPTVGYGKPCTARTAFRRVRDVDDASAIRAILPRAARWASGDATDVAPGTLGDRAGLLALADAADAGLDPEVHGALSFFAVRVGARRAADAAWALGSVGAVKASRILVERARLIGGMQEPVTAGESIAPMARRLAATCDPLAEALADAAASLM